MRERAAVMGLFPVLLALMAGFCTGFSVLPSSITSLPQLQPRTIEGEPAARRDPVVDVVPGERRLTPLRAATGIPLSPGTSAPSGPSVSSSGSADEPRVGVLLLNLGGPETGDDVEGECNNIVCDVPFD